MDEIMNHCIDEIWKLYDFDNSGYLDREEAYRFVKESIQHSDNEDNLKTKKKKLSIL